MRAGEPDRAGLAMQSVVKRRANRENASAGPALRFEDDDGTAGRAKEFSRAQPRQAGADDHNRRIVDSRCAGSQRERGEGRRVRRVAEKPPAVHGKPNAMMFDPAAIATYCLLSNT